MLGVTLLVAAAITVLSALTRATQLTKAGKTAHLDMLPELLPIVELDSACPD